MDSPSANRKISGCNFNNASNKSEVTSTSETTENTAVQLSYTLETAIIEIDELKAEMKRQQLDGYTKYMNVMTKDKEMDWRVELLNSRIEIENLTNNLNKAVIEEMAVRQELISASAQFKIDLDGKSERLRIANADLCELREINGMLTIKNEEYMYKLHRQFDESAKLIKHYDDELKAKTDLAEMYKENNDQSQAFIYNLTDANAELNRLVDETYDEYRILETKLNDSELLNRNESTASNDIIVKLKQELHDANSLLKVYHNHDDVSGIVDSEIVDIFPTFSRRPLRKGMTLTEIYTQYRNVVKELQHKEQECTFLELEMKNLIEDTQKASHLVRVLRDMRATDVDLDDSLVAETFYCEAMDNSRSRCESVTTENDEIKSTLTVYTTEEFLTMSTDTASTPSDFRLPHDTIELQQHRQIVNVPVLATIENPDLGVGPSTINVLPTLENVSEGNSEESLNTARASKQKIEKLEQENASTETNMEQYVNGLVASNVEIPNQTLVAVQAENLESSTTKSDILKSIVLGTPKPTLPLQADSLKRSINAQRARRSRRSNKRARTSFVESSEGLSDSSTEDEIIVCDDAIDQDFPDIELEFITSNSVHKRRFSRASNPRRTCNNRSQSLSHGNGQVTQAPQRCSDRQRCRNRTHTNEKD